MRSFVTNAFSGIAVLSLVLAAAEDLSAQQYLGVTPGSLAGTSAAVTVDFDLDGLLDLAYGAPGTAPTAAGSIRIVSQVPGAPAIEFVGAAPSDHLGADVVSYDLNSDGVQDLLVLAPGANLIYAIDGSALIGWPSGILPITVAPQLWAPILQPGLGTDVEAGDLQGNGTVQIVAGSPSLRSYSVYDAVTTALLASRTLAGTNSYGTSILIAEVNSASPGLEIVVAAPNVGANLSWIETNRYMAGNLTLLVSIVPPAHPITGQNVGAGVSLVSGGDFNADGVNDVIACGGANGGGYFIIGFNGPSVVIRQFFLNIPGVSFGQSCAVVADSTGDGIPEYVIGAPGLATGVGSGAVAYFDGGAGAYLGLQADPMPGANGFGSFMVPNFPGITPAFLPFSLLVGAPQTPVLGLATGSLWLF